MRHVVVGAVHSTDLLLREMARCGISPLAVLSLPPELTHRHSDYVDIPQTAADLGVPFYSARDVNDPAVLQLLRELQPEVIWVVGWSQLVKSDFLSLPSVGVVGYHPAALPKNRGRAVIPWTILQNAVSTGSTLFWISEGMDDGDIILQETFDVAPDETSESLYAKHLESLRRMLGQLLSIDRPEDYPRVAQDHSQASYCARRSAEDGLIDWGEPAEEVWRLVRAAGRPYPGAFTYHGQDRVTIWRAEVVRDLDYWALPGQIVAVDDRGPVIHCGDRRQIRVLEWSGWNQSSGSMVGKRLGPKGRDR